ncbi:MAG: sugar ABC transporter ATP-binding protein [Clostridiaceae bacterium]|jgi:ABC-type sugar transport system ATPase subunit|nr:sugar ABC transporter ATP-binding protein [Clostridiaceae bacterium]
MNDIAIQLEHITKTFPGVKALDDVSIQIQRGTVHALVGENGAGKSTLIKILSGIYQPDAGDIYINGKKKKFKVPVEAQRAGISVVHQEFKLSETLTVTENIFLGNLIYTKAKLVNWKEMRKRAEKMISDLQVELDPDTIVQTLSVAKKQIVEICKSISREASIIIMDEPSATLTERELEVLFGIVRTLRDSGYTIIYISHRMDEIFGLADNISVLRDGCHVATMPVAEVTRDKLITLMVGRELENEFIKHNCSISDEVILEAKKVSRAGVLQDIDLQLRKGEVLGIAGLVGAGRTELARALLGIDKIDSGEVLYKGQPVKWNFRTAIKNGLGLVPEDRKRFGLSLQSTVKNNITLTAIDKVLEWGLLNLRKEYKYAEWYVEKLRVVTPSVETKVMNLSGGNQQKVVIAKWLMADSEIMILDEPTRGVDVGAKRELYGIIKDLIEQGKTVIVISSEMPELLSICDRIVVMSRGRLVGEFAHGEGTQEKILSLCV